MEKMNDLRDLLKHEIEDLYSVEEQIIDALPAMIEKASNTTLKNSLTDHLRITEQQKERLDKVQQMLSIGNEEENGTKKKKFLGIFGGGSHKCKGMEGIINEGKKMMDADMDTEVMDAALIACAQKIEHYEICGYGTARSYASELGLDQISGLLELTLDEEYEADDKLTFLAESRINKQAEKNEKRTTSTGASQKTRPGTKAATRRKEMELEPVSTQKHRTEPKRENRPERGGHPKAATTPRSSAGRSVSSSSRGTAGKSRSASSKNSEGSRKNNRSGNSGSR